MINIHWLSLHPNTPPRGYWDTQWIEDICTGSLWQIPSHPMFTHTEGPEIPTSIPGSIVAIPGRTHYNDIGEINILLAQLHWVVVIVSGDEESVFPVDKLIHPNITIWVQTPDSNHPPVGHYVGDMLPPHCQEQASKSPVQARHRPLNFFFSGQVTHPERRACRDALRSIQDQGTIVETPGFTLGLPYPEYISYLASSKVAPCPSGPFTPDTFRLFESLECGCIPVTLTHPYWSLLFNGDIPWPTIDSWADFPDKLRDILSNYPSNANHIFSWWQQYKRTLTYSFINSIDSVRTNRRMGLNVPSDLITAIIPTSPIPSHPSPDHILTTIDSIRAQLPTCEILIMIDGVREEQMDRYEDYQEYIRRLLWVINTDYHNVAPVIYTDFLHQAEMTRRTIPLISTPLLIYVEHDTPLTGEIDWISCTQAITEGFANTIRFHHEASVLQVHEHLMLDREPKHIMGATLQRTVQWSQRPHLSSTAYYTWMLDQYFSPDSRTYIEDVVYSPIVSDWHSYGVEGWDRHKLWLYTPTEGSIKRSEHIDSRGSDPKYGITP